MARWTSTWLSGLESAGVALKAEGDWGGKGYGLPAEGPGSVATFNSRLGAVLVDLLVGALIGGLINSFVTDPGLASKQGAGVGALVLMYAVLLPTTGQTLGMRVARIRVLRLKGGLLAVPAAFVRGLLVALTLPALFTDREGRGLHDKLVGSVVVRA
jgi:uncharacterized RDD family membrane protein YckC